MVNDQNWMMTFSWNFEISIYVATPNQQGPFFFPHLNTSMPGFAVDFPLLHRQLSTRGFRWFRATPLTHVMFYCTMNDQRRYRRDFSQTWEFKGGIPYVSDVQSYIQAFACSPLSIWRVKWCFHTMGVPPIIQNQTILVFKPMVFGTPF